MTATYRVDVLVVGASVGGMKLARALGAAQYEGTIAIVDGDRDAPYDKPALSKRYLFPGDRQSIELGPGVLDLVDDVRLGVRATTADLESQWVRLEDGTEIHYRHLVVATGCRPRPAPWREAAFGALQLRTRADADRLRAAIARGGRLVVVGGGLIGSEVAATARLAGLGVSVVERETSLMSRVLPVAVAERVAQMHRRHDVRIELGADIHDVRVREEVATVLLADGRRIEGNSVLLALGAVPNVEWLANTGADVSDGIRCDQHGRILGALSAWAVGDVAAWQSHPGVYRRAENWTSALVQAEHVAQQIQSAEACVRDYHPETFVWTDQFDWKIQSVGSFPTSGQVEVVDNPLRPGSFAATSWLNRAVTGVVTVNWPQHMARARQSLRATGDLPASPLGSARRNAWIGAGMADGGRQWTG